MKYFVEKFGDGIRMRNLVRYYRKVFLAYDEYQLNHEDENEDHIEDENKENPDQEDDSHHTQSEDEAVPTTTTTSANVQPQPFHTITHNQGAHNTTTV